jgi:hypothetical protein
MQQTAGCSFTKDISLGVALALVPWIASAVWADEITSNGAIKQADQSSGQVLNDTNGNTFMEEIPSSRPKQQQRAQEKLVPDLSTVGVPVNPNGNIVPLINKSAGPVLPFYSQFETSVEPLWQFSPMYPYGYPAYPGVYFGRSPYPVYSYYGRTRPYIWSYRSSSRVGFVNFPSSYPPNLYSVNPWFTPPVVTPPGF